MMPTPSTITLVCSLTMMSMPAQNALAWMTVSRLVNLASRRSMSIPAIIAKAVCVGPTSHTPLRLTPPMIAIEES